MTARSKFLPFHAGEVNRLYTGLSTGLDKVLLFANTPGGYSLHYGPIGQRLPRIPVVNVDPISENKWSVYPVCIDYMHMMLTESVTDNSCLTDLHGAGHYRLWVGDDDLRVAYLDHDEQSAFVTHNIVGLSWRTIEYLEKAAKTLYGQLVDSMRVLYPAQLRRTALQQIHSAASHVIPIADPASGISTVPVPKACLFRLTSLGEAYKCKKIEENWDDTDLTYHVWYYEAIWRLLGSVGVHIPVLNLKRPVTA